MVVKCKGAHMRTLQHTNSPVRFLVSTKEWRSDNINLRRDEIALLQNPVDAHSVVERLGGDHRHVCGQVEPHRLVEVAVHLDR